MWYYRRPKEGDIMSAITEQIIESYGMLKDYLDSIVIGEENAKDVLIASLLCDTNSHILLLGQPGTCKSTISNNLAQNFTSKKIFITSDLLPSDILEALKSKEDLQDLQLEELNRASGKVQSSLIETLGDNKINGDPETPGFYVMATQNDSEISGIFDVPMAIYDRFDVNITLGNLTEEELEQVLFEYRVKIQKAKFDLNKCVNTTSKIIDDFVFTKEDRRVFMDSRKEIDTYLYLNRTKLFGSSNIRGHFFAIRMATFHALAHGRDWIMPDDIADYVSNIYLHRINQTIVKMNDEKALNAMNEIENNILSKVKRKEK